MDDDVPDFGDVEGLARLVVRAIEARDKMDLPDYERQTWLTEIEEHYKAARDVRGNLSQPYRLGM